MRQWGRRASGGRETGAALVEFALILPLMMMLLLGMFSGGLAYNRKISLTNGAREASRYGATLPVSGSVNTWLDRVADVATNTAEGELGTSVPGRYICVAFVNPASTGGATTRRVEDGTTVTYTAGSTCYSDGTALANATRVQVVVKRRSTLETVLWNRDLVLEGRSTVRFEALQ